MVAGVSPQPSNYPLVNRLLAVDPLNVRGAEFTTLLAALDQIGAGVTVGEVQAGLERLGVEVSTVRQPSQFSEDVPVTQDRLGYGWLGCADMDTVAIKRESDDLFVRLGPVVRFRVLESQIHAAGFPVRVQLPR